MTGPTNHNSQSNYQQPCLIFMHWNFLVQLTNQIHNFTKQSVLPLIKKPASSRSPTRSHTSLLVTQCNAVTAPLWPLSMRTLVWIFFWPKEDRSCLQGAPFSFAAKQERERESERDVMVVYLNIKHMHKYPQQTMYLKLRVKKSQDKWPKFSFLNCLGLKMIQWFFKPLDFCTVLVGSRIKLDHLYAAVITLNILSRPTSNSKHMES